MKTVEFTLTMPERPSWDGRWSGDCKNYSMLRRVTDNQCQLIFGDSGSIRAWKYHWTDGWVAQIMAVKRLANHRVSNRKVDFCGYDWMVDEIIATGNLEDETRPVNVPDGVVVTVRGVPRTRPIDD